MTTTIVKPPEKKICFVQKIFLVRGLPGSGKTTFAQTIMYKVPSLKGWVHVENDMFFTDPVTGAYRFNEKELKNASMWCLNTAKEALENGEDVVVSNSFIKRIHFAPYVRLAFRMKIFSMVYICRGNYESIHNVPASSFERMNIDWEE